MAMKNPRNSIRHTHADDTGVLGGHATGQKSAENCRQADAIIGVSKLYLQLGKHPIVANAAIHFGSSGARRFGIRRRELRGRRADSSGHFTVVIAALDGMAVANAVDTWTFIEGGKIASRDDYHCRVV